MARCFERHVETATIGLEGLQPLHLSSHVHRFRRAHRPCNRERLVEQIHHTHARGPGHPRDRGHERPDRAGPDDADMETRQGTGLRSGVQCDR
jgi:hypothetical protein